MSALRPASPGKTRVCPHCKAVILESSSVCPGCQHHLRFGGDPSQRVEVRTALQVEGKIKHPPQEEPWEYTVVVYIRNERGEEVARHVINVGALSSSEERVVSLAVDVMPPKPFVPVAPRPAATPPATAASPLAAAKPPLVTPPPPAAAAAQQPKPPNTPAAAPPGPLRPARETLQPPRPGDPYPTGFGRGPKPR